MCSQLVQPACTVVWIAQEWEKPDYLLPVNLGRVHPLEWLKSIAAEKRRETIIALIADRFSAQLSTFRSLHVSLLLDEKSVEEKAEWEATVRSTLAAYPIELSVDCRPASEGLSSLSNSIDQHEVPATLILAGQFWTAGTNPGYSEGVAGILLRSTKPAARSHDKNEFSGCRLCDRSCRRPTRSARICTLLRSSRLYPTESAVRGSARLIMRQPPICAWESAIVLRRNGRQYAIWMVRWVFGAGKPLADACYRDRNEFAKPETATRRNS